LSEFLVVKEGQLFIRLGVQKATTEHNTKVSASEQQTPTIRPCAFYAFYRETYPDLLSKIYDSQVLSNFFRAAFALTCFKCKLTFVMKKDSDFGR
uniref:Uncharacterized protein n=1 Tax=Romanomermis culicivorax TaxID=13658 RepID=A0A915IVJ2_ROMCU